MNIELDEVVVLDVSDDVLELAACGAQGGNGVVGAGCCFPTAQPSGRAAGC